MESGKKLGESGWKRKKGKRSRGGKKLDPGHEMTSKSTKSDNFNAANEKEGKKRSSLEGN